MELKDMRILPGASMPANEPDGNLASAPAGCGTDTGRPRTQPAASGFKRVGWHLCCAVLCAGALGLVCASPARAVDDNENSTPTAWWFYTGQTYSEVGATVSKLDARIVSIKANVANGTYTVTYVKNTGSYAKAWWWYVGIDGTTLAQNLTNNNARLISLQAYDIGGGNIRFAVAMISNTGADAKGWWYYYNASPSWLASQATANNARITNLESYVSNGNTYYAAIMISNTGADAKGWWWYYNASAQSVGSAINTNNARLLDLTSAGNGNFNAVMESCSTGCPAWWWWYGMGPYGVLDKAQDTGARVMAADAYPGNCSGSSTCFVTVNIGNVPSDIKSCDLNGCISQKNLITNIQNKLNNNVVGYAIEVGGIAPRYGGLARTATDGSLGMAPDLVTDIASVSKTMTATGVLQLLAKDGLSPDTPISKYIYGDWAQGPNINQLTFRNLLTHTSGLAQSSSNCGTNGTGPTSGIDYAGVEGIIARGVPNPSNIGVPQYGNCNFAVLRELMPALEGKNLLNYQNGTARADKSSALYLSYMNAHVFSRVSVPESYCTPPGSDDILSYPYPAGGTPGTDWGDWSLTCGSGGWVLSANQIFRVIDDLAAGHTLLSKSERDEMFAGCLGWDCAVRNDCPSPYVCKNGDLNNGPGTANVWTYAGVLKCNVPVVVVVNSPLPSFYENGEDIIGLVKDSYNAAGVTGTARACK